MEYKLILGDCLEFMRTMPSGSVDAVVTDPPYLYLVGHKLDRKFNEKIFFDECKRILKKQSMIVLFGRGTSFYRWNTRLHRLGFSFKEEIVWDKSYSTSPLLAINRVHETISIHSIGGKKINKVKIPYTEAKGHDIGSIIEDVRRIKRVLKDTKILDSVLEYLENNKIIFEGDDRPLSVSVSSGIPGYNRHVAVIQQIKNGMGEKSIIRTDRKLRSGVSVDGGDGIVPERKSGNRVVNLTNSIACGMGEKSIIKVSGVHYGAYHPTQKPVALIERLINLVCQPGDTIFDPFMGSGTTGVACMQTGRNFIGCEIDHGYFEIARRRIELAAAQPLLPGM